MSKYYTISPEDGARYLKARGSDDEVLLDDIIKTAGSGEMVSNAALKDLEIKLTQVKKRFPATLRSKDPAGGKFESQACEIVHRCLEGLDAATLADYDFWTFLAVAKLSEIVDWRFGVKEGHANLANYGVGNRGENLIYRLWLRAELGKDDQLPDAYLLAKLGDQDLWRSHILRQGYANVRPVAKALLKLQAGLLKAKKLVGGDDKEGIRMLAKLLKRLRANVEFQFLKSEEVEEVVLEMCAGLKTVKV